MSGPQDGPARLAALAAPSRKRSRSRTPEHEAAEAESLCKEVVKRYKELRDKHIAEQRKQAPSTIAANKVRMQCSTHTMHAP